MLNVRLGGVALQDPHLLAAAFVPSRGTFVGDEPPSEGDPVALPFTEFLTVQGVRHFIAKRWCPPA